MRLKELRLKKGVTQQEVAVAIGCSANNYARYERGERVPDKEIFRLLTNYFKVTVDYIWEFTDKNYYDLEVQNG